MTGSSPADDRGHPADGRERSSSARAGADRRGRAHPSGSWWPLSAVAVLVYLPFLATRRGVISADTKTYLYLDPSRLLGRAWSIWDPNVGLGTVSHQTIGYLWPMGPWYWLFEALGVPDWIAQRLWWGTLLFATIAGGAYLLRRFSMPAIAVWPAAIVLGLSPYSVAYLGRLSGVMLPAVGLPWLLAFTIQSVRHQRWRHPALFALTVTTVGSINLTALVLVGIVPLLWMPWAIVSREAEARSVLRATARIGILTVATSAWWLAGLSVQASHGIDIVRYTESAEVVARTALAFEVLRGLGYWFFYGGDKLELWIEPSFEYTKRRLLFALSFVVPGLALLSNLIGRWRHRIFFAGLLVVGVVLSVGPNPWSDPSPFGRLVRVFLATDRGLAFRSLPRAVPVVALAMAVLLAGFIAVLHRRDRRLGLGAAGIVTMAAIVGMIPLWQRSIVQDSLARRDVPEYWMEAARLLDDRDDGTRVLEVPGSDFASYRWGNTVDPITPGLMDRPYVARELVPWGSAMAADLVNDLDLLLQERTLRSEAIAPIARLMRVGDIAFRGDLQYDRYALARPRQVWDLLERAPGLGPAIPLTPPVENEPTGRFRMWDENWVLDDRHLPDAPALAVFPVRGSRPILDAKPASGAVLVSGDGAGLVSAAAAGRITGDELIRYSASADAEAIREALANDADLIVTDTNRRRGERWGSLRHNRGETERADQQPMVEDPTDNRLPRFPGRGPETETVTIQEGSLTVDASSYGNPITYAADDRAALAVDGDLDTAWATAAFSDARGERLRIVPDEPLRLDHLVLHQLSEDRSQRMITRIRIDLGDGEPFEVDLEAVSRTEAGQRIDFDARRATRVEITILADDLGPLRDYSDAGPVGFAEVKLGEEAPVVDEIVRVPTDLVDAVAGADELAATRLTYLFERLRQDPTDRTRDDEERAILRRFRTPDAREFGFRAVGRLSARADDPILDRVLGTSMPGVVEIDSSHRLAGSRIERASAAFDDDPTTAWTGAWALTEDEHLTVRTAEPHRFESFDMTVVADGLHTVPERIGILVDDELVETVDLPAIEDQPIIDHAVTVPVEFEPAVGRELRLEFRAVRPVRSVDWTANDDLDHPIAITNIDLPGISVTSPSGTLDDRCRHDLASLDGDPIGLRVIGSVRDAEQGRTLDFEPCSDEPIRLGAGDHDLVIAPGVTTGFDIDRIVLDDPEPEGTAVESEPIRVEGVPDGPNRNRITLTDLPVGEPVWVILGQSHNDGWTAKVRDGDDLGAPELVDGYANGWLLVPDSESVTVDLEFTPQKRVTLALGLSAVAIVIALALVFADPGPGGRPGPLFVPNISGGAPPRRFGARTSILAGLLVGGAAVFFSGLAVGFVVAVLTAAAASWTPMRFVLRIAPAALLGATVLLAIFLQTRHGLPAGIQWISDLQPLHPIAMTAVMLFGAELVLRVLEGSADAPADGPEDPEAEFSPWWRRRSG